MTDTPTPDQDKRLLLARQIVQDLKDSGFITGQDATTLDAVARCNVLPLVREYMTPAPKPEPREGSRILCPECGKGVEPNTGHVCTMNPMTTPAQDKRLDEIRGRHNHDTYKLILIAEEPTQAHEDRGFLLRHIAALEAQLAAKARPPAGEGVR